MDFIDSGKPAWSVRASGLSAMFSSLVPPSPTLFFSVLSISLNSGTVDSEMVWWDSGVTVVCKHVCPSQQVLLKMRPCHALSAVLLKAVLGLTSVCQVRQRMDSLEG